ncbi:MAG: hypothetical protein IT305_04610 [Chloroflexi bacterium]|nr:hypothetical protein [Chloroflexota bacterium]
MRSQSASGASSKRSELPYDPTPLPADRPGPAAGQFRRASSEEPSSADGVGEVSPSQAATGRTATFTTILARPGQALGLARLSRLGRLAPRWRTVTLGLVIFILLAPLVSLLQQASVTLAARALSTATALIEAYLLPLLPVDPVYAGAGLHVLGGIEPRGLAVAGHVGALLHGALPLVFASPDSVAPGAAVSALLAPGATVFARALSAIAATTLVVVLCEVVRRRLHLPAWAALGAALTEAFVLVDQAISTSFTLRDLEATGLPFALAAFSPVGEGGQRILFTRYLDGVPDSAIGLSWGLLTAGACVILAQFIVAAPGPARSVAASGARAVTGVAAALRRSTGGRAERLDQSPRRLSRPRSAPSTASRRLGWSLARLRRSPGRPHWSSRRAMGLVHVAVLVAVTAGVTVSPLGAAVDGETTIAPTADELAFDGPVDDPLDDPLAADNPGAGGQADEIAGLAAAEEAGLAAVAGGQAPAATVSAAPAAVAVTADATAAPTATAASTPATVRAASASTRSVVAVKGHNYHYTYLVNGKPTVIRGMGYNPWYASLPVADRRTRYDRDFAEMRSIGINTIEGWFENQFDRVTLDAAQAQGIGVIMPFELNQDYDYSRPEVQQAFIDLVATWVLRYKDHPAVRMWGPGNENLHRLIFPTMVKGQRDPAREARADAFAAFYVRLIDTIHALDPYHPVVYRDAEDLYFNRIRDALQRDGKPRPWFVYGTNVYTPRLADVIRNWPTRGLDAPLLVSEFAPGGVAPADRPRMLAQYWGMIRAQPDRVIGGVVYTWATEGPEDLDRVFGLTDPNGKPVDGSLSALRRLFQDDPVARAP